MANPDRDGPSPAGDGTPSSVNSRTWENGASRESANGFTLSIPPSYYHSDTTQSLPQHIPDHQNVSTQGNLPQGHHQSSVPPSQYYAPSQSYYPTINQLNQQSTRFLAQGGHGTESQRNTAASHSGNHDPPVGPSIQQQIPHPPRLDPAGSSYSTDYSGQPISRPAFSQVHCSTSQVENAPYQWISRQLPPPQPRYSFPVQPQPYALNHSIDATQLAASLQAPRLQKSVAPAEPIARSEPPPTYIPFHKEKLELLKTSSATDDQQEQEPETSADEVYESMDDVNATEDDQNTTTSRKRGRGRQSSGVNPRRKRRRRTGKRGGWSKGMQLGHRPAIDPGPEFAQLYQDAHDAWIELNIDEALEFCLKAIAINPEIYAAHALLSEIYFHKGEDEKGIAALFSGAHSIPTDPDVWRRVATACLERSTGDQQRALQQASYCYARIISKSGKDWEARLQRASVNKQLGNYRKAISDLETILEHKPRDSDAMRLVADICVETRDLSKAIALYEEALDHYKQHGFQGEEEFTWADVLVYVQLLAQEEPLEMALSNSIAVLKRLSRWLLGRQDETYWDDYTEDDREWDSEDDPRRTEVPLFVPGKYPADSYGPGLPLELRARLGMLRLKQGPQELEEALAHFEWLEADARDIDAALWQYHDLFFEVAQALHDIKEHNQALRYLEALKDAKACEDVPEFWILIAANSYLCGNKEQAIECYEEARSLDENGIEARTQLSKLYADLGDKGQAMECAREAVIIADNSLKKTERRKYERKEQRLAREDAENALRDAYKMPGQVDSGIPVNELEKRLQRPPTYRQRKTASELIARIAKDTASGASLRTINNDLNASATGDTEDAQASKDDKPRRPRKEPSTRRVRQAALSNPKRLTVEEREAHRTETINNLYQTLLDNTDAMRAGDRVARHVWMDCADSLIIDFRTNRAFFPGERNAKKRTPFDKDMRLASRTQNEANELDPDIPMPSVESFNPTTYRDISFEEWLDVFLEYAVILANELTLSESSPDAIETQRHRSYAIIRAAMDCVIWYNDPPSMLLIHTTWLICALSLRDENTLFNVVLRWFARKYQFCTDAYRLFAALNLIYPHPTHKDGKEGQVHAAAFRAGPSQKFWFRQIMIMDANLPSNYSPEGFGPVPSNMRNLAKEMRRDDADGGGLVMGSGANDKAPTLQEMDVVLLSLYGHILYAGNSFPSALSYFFRALSLDPKNPIILLSVALCYLHELLKRQNLDRHMYALQGWSFFEEYVDSRRAWASTKDEKLQNVVEREIELNRARCWQMLGLSDLAVRSYEKLLPENPVSSPTSVSDPTSKAAAEMIDPELLRMDESQQEQVDTATDPKPTEHEETQETSLDDGPEKDMHEANTERETIPEDSVEAADFNMEAAYAIQTMYALSGNALMAREITEKYLVV
ncbi:transcription factor TFIIIC subunit tfc4 [Knufia peltigerae]|uniref:Transcription factor TFIIIC subunit tfc4 n=1 Tax=Knufia peltigerae TaxID=1002370 RepID=A0AA38XRI7_9EURO|nr:transcription factor TFIIIC subunit tfc4 [Knufia peltigerae]